MSQVFEDWMKKHTRSYQNNEEKARRFQIFKEKYLYVQASNNEGAKKNRLYTVGLNAYSDMTREEFGSKKCRRASVATGGFNITYLPDYNIKEEYNTNLTIDWVEQGVVSPVRDQGSHCGACWAIAAVGSVEAANRLAWGPNNYDQIRELSIQQILDCARGEGCDGGSELDAYVYILKNRGLATEEDYPYTQMNGTCDLPEDNTDDYSSIDGIAVVRPLYEVRLKQALGIRPVTAGIAANSSEFENYAGGIFNGPCGEEIDHTVFVVGFGKDDKGVGFWKIQNSWGESWGEQGYMRMSIEAGSKCQILQEASFPWVV